MNTEFVKFKVLETTTDEQLISEANSHINGFQKKQDGFIDTELVKNIEENEWYFIFHYENIEKIKAVGEKMRKNKSFDQLNALIVPGSIRVTLYHHLRNWKLKV